MGRIAVVLPLSVSLVFTLSTTTRCMAQQVINPSLRARLVTSTRAPELVSLKSAPQSWDRFEAEFGLQQDDPTLIRGNIRRVKYSMDLVTFSVDSFLRNTERALELKYANGAIHRAAAAHSEPSPDLGHAGAFDDTRLKFDIDLTHGKPYVGLRLVIPFGN